MAHYLPLETSRRVAITTGIGSLRGANTRPSREHERALRQMPENTLLVSESGRTVQEPDFWGFATITHKITSSICKCRATASRSSKKYGH